MSPVRTDISWLHLSDFHLREKNKWSQDIVLSSLLDDVRWRFSGQSKPDLLFLTGDIAFSGKAEEYQLAEHFIRQLQEATSVPQDKLFIIPGNHDIDRTLEEDAFTGARINLKDIVEVDKFFANEGRRKTLFRREESFRAFANRIAPPDKGGYTSSSFAHYKQTSIGHINIRVSLLDSAWLAEGGDADMGNLLIGESQIIESCSRDINALSFGLVHHPFAWLREFEQIPIENLLLDRVHIMLRGHVHSVDIRAVEALEHRLPFFTAGATFETRTSNNSYGWGSLDLSTGVGEFVDHKYVHAAKRWQASAPQVWSINKMVSPLPLKDAVEFSTEIGGTYIYYRALLLAGHITEIPRIINDKPIFMNFEVELPNDENLLGQLVLKLRNHFQWRNVWNDEQWHSEVSRLAQHIDSKLNLLESAASEIHLYLTNRERQCRRNAEAVAGVGILREATPVLEEIANLERSSEWQRILDIIHRWVSQGLLTDEEKDELDRMEVKAHIELANYPEAIKKVLSIIESNKVRPTDYYLASTCYYLAKEYQNACKFMHLAIDNNVEVEVVRRLALQIAGQTGDAKLTQRVVIYE